MSGVAAFVVDRGRQTTHTCYNLYPTVEMLTTRDGPTVIDAKTRYWSKISIFAQLGGPVVILLRLVLKKTRMVWLPKTEKNMKICLYSFRQNRRT